MPMNRNILPLLIIVVLLSSCATVFNSSEQGIAIYTSEPAILVVNNDTLENTLMYRHITVSRSKDTIAITAISPSEWKSVQVHPKNSLAYWANYYPTPLFWTGFLIDRNNPKRYTYPGTLYIDLKDRETPYLLYRPLDDPYKGYKHAIKFTPYKTIQLINSGMELSYERKFSDYYTTQVSTAYLFPYNYISADLNLKPGKGFQIGMEQRLYLKKSAPKGTYIAVEFSYLNNKHYDYWMFGHEYPTTPEEYQYNYLDTFAIYKQTYSFNLKLGYQYIYKRLAVDLYGGLGYRYKDVRHSGRLKPEDEMVMPHSPNIYYISNNQGRYPALSVPFHIRIGWRF
jgi:hypothetical protein